MLDLHRILVIGFNAINGLKPGELQELPKDKASTQLRRELRWCLKHLAQSSESRIKAELGTSCRSVSPPQEF